MSTTSDGRAMRSFMTGNERLPAGDGLGVGLAEQLERVLEVGRTCVAGRRGNHEAASTARIDSTIPW